MDPTAWKLKGSSLRATEAKERAEDLLGWLRKDGFAPRIGGHPTFDRLVAESICKALIERKEFYPNGREAIWIKPVELGRGAGCPSALLLGIVWLKRR